ncbi:transposase [Streptomyces sp. NPDC102490]|jgi:transposase|uniref:transposase n=1 Tax=Streptomyces sp. NPDC102490 TaxID=3366183 RepID=UPI00381F144C
MAMKDYSNEFKADAVALFESTSGATCKGITADLGIGRGTLRKWVLRDRKHRGQGPAASSAGARRTAASKET